MGKRGVNIVFDISIHAPRGGSDVEEPAAEAAAPSISIHAPCGGSDFPFAYPPHPRAEISIHAPRGGSDAQGV